MEPEDVVRLRQVLGRLSRRLNASSTGEGLTPTQASVLGIVVARGPIALAELTEVEALNPTMVSRIVGALTELGLIVRVADPDDLRSASLQATPAGRRVDRRIKRQRSAVVSECLELLDAEDVAALEQALPALESLAEAITTREPARRREGRASSTR